MKYARMNCINKRHRRFLVAASLAGFFVMLVIRFCCSDGKENVPDGIESLQRWNIVVENVGLIKDGMSMQEVEKLIGPPSEKRTLYQVPYRLFRQKQRGYTWIYIEPAASGKEQAARLYIEYDMSKRVVGVTAYDLN